MKKLIILFFSIIMCYCRVHSIAGADTLKGDGNMDSSSKYYFPDENQKHEGTWLIWPHKHTYGKKYAESIEYIWIEMTEALSKDEKVHIIAYDKTLKNRIINILSKKNVNMDNVDFVIAKSNDVWARDTGPIFVYNDKKQLEIADFGFNKLISETKADAQYYQTLMIGFSIYFLTVKIGKEVGSLFNLYNKF